MAYMLVHLAGIDEHCDANRIKDRGQSQFPNEIANAIACGMMQLDDKNRFYPLEEVERKDAIFALDNVLQWMDHKQVEEEKAEITYQKDIQEVESIEEVDEETFKIQSPKAYKENDVIEDDGHFYEIQTIVESNRTKDGVEQVIKVKEVNLEDLIDDMDVEGSFEINFDNAEIIDETSGVVVQEIRSVEEGVQNMMVEPFKTFTTNVHGYKVSYTISQTTMKAEILKEYDHGTKLFANAKIYSVNPQYHWNMKHGKLKDSYYKVHFKTMESIGFRNGTHKYYYGDLTKIDPSDFEKTVDNLFAEQKQMESVTIPIATFKVPIPNAPMFQITMKLQVRLYANGRCEVVLNQDHVEGFETKNGMFRTIHKHDYTNKALVRADGSAITACTFGLDMKKVPLANIGVETGTKFHASSTLHFYDDVAKHHKKKLTNVPADLAEQQSHKYEDLYVCNDIKAYLFMDLRMNSADTMAARFGFTKQFPLLNEKDGSLIPILTAHAENWQLMEECTHKDRTQLLDEFEVPPSDRIEVEDCSLLLKKNQSKSIVITGLPKTYSLKDLRYTSEDPLIAQVEQGNVKANNEGSTIIHIQTVDGMYAIDVNVKVREVEE